MSDNLKLDVEAGTLALNDLIHPILEGKNSVYVVGACLAEAVCAANDMHMPRDYFMVMVARLFDGDFRRRFTQ